ncbi:CRM-domain containing factor CFM9, mitochondrial [Sesamum alatum]|uniref:CRM-domain containing factor CFM9, mitochondrial n=1 Tax=Sesamum alatum TaxID=300844 RepID=A0AAE2CD78_9LAMI|nr:CRM-domain containing factor CFM9, mitochondrial [Sesamum alatum]
MFSACSRNLQKQSLRKLSSLLLNQRNAMPARISDHPKLISGISNVSFPGYEVPSAKMWSAFDGVRGFSAKSMRSKVEKRMQRESGKTLREIRRAKKLRKKLMTDEERLIYNLRRAKKKVALLLQKLKKYELPELPPPRHDPELLTLEQLQAYKKIGFRNKNYVPVGVRGVFGGVVQNMHLHWKFHETVQVCCDNFPKEKIKEMATMLARLSGGIVVNVHNVKTIIMFRGRNYRQPKNLIPINTLTKRKALFKARFEQALESQKLNIKKTEQELRRKGINPDDPVAMASIQRVASTFFNAIDKREGSPYVFREDKTTQVESEGLRHPSDAGDDSDQEELDRFIADIEDAADKEWAAEEAAEKEELGRIRYWNREDFGGRYRRSEGIRSEDSDDENRARMRNWNQVHGRTVADSDGGDGDVSDLDDEWDSNDIEEVDHGSDGDDSEEVVGKLAASKRERWQHRKNGRPNSKGFKGNEFNGRKKYATVSKDVLSDLEDVASESEGEGQNMRDRRASTYNYRSSTDDENYEQLQGQKRSNSKRGFNRGTAAEFEKNSTYDDLFSEPEIAKWESDATSGEECYNHGSDGEGKR